MTKSTFGRLAGGLVALAGLTYGAGTGTASAAKPTPHPTYPPVALKVTVLPVDSIGNECRICSDGQGQYLDGIDGVAARLDAYGNVIIDFGTGNQRFRELRFDFSRPVDPANTYQPPAPRTNSYLSTQTHPAGHIQNMPVGTEQCIQSNLTFNVGSALYRIHFQRPLTGDVSQTSYLVVTRTNADTWELEPGEAACNTGIPTRAKLFFNGDRGEWYMPFRMILERR
jgi:hypothetical protein